VFARTQKLHQYKKQLLHSDKDRQKALLQADEYHEALIKVTQVSQRAAAVGSLALNNIGCLSRCADALFLRGSLWTQQPLVTRPAEDQQATVSDTGYASQLASLKSRQGNYIDASERTRIAYTP